jgi:uncharacterized protein
VNTYLNNRVLKFNVGFLLNEGPAHSHDAELDLPAVRISDDLLVDHVRGPLRLSRTKEGILVQAELEVGLSDECYRCLDPVERKMDIEIQELYAFHRQNEVEFSIGEDAILDLNPLLRAEVLIGGAQRSLCRPDCKGLCSNCGANLNYETCDCDREDIDPRFAALKNLLDNKP